MDRAEGALLVAELALSETRSLAERVLHLGEDVDPELVRTLVAEAVAEAIAAIPTPKDGEPGRKGDPADIVFLPEDLAFEVADCVKFLHESPDIRRTVTMAVPPAPPTAIRNVLFERDEHQRIVGARLTNGDAA